MTVRVGRRDAQVLAACARGRWLTTGQLKRLCFGGVTPDAVRKSLRRLHTAGYLLTHRENRMSEALHAVGPKGKSVLEGKGIPVELTRTPPRQRAHLVGINDVRVAVLTSGLAVAFFFAAWELGEFRWTYEIVPDAVFALRVPERHAFIVEYDRGTETRETLLAKLRRYAEGLAGFPFRAVVVLAESRGSLQDLGASLRRQDAAVRVLRGSIDDIRQSGIRSAVFADLADPAEPRVCLLNLIDVRSERVASNPSDPSSRDS